MSQCLQSPDGFIKGLFSPRIAVLCSQDAEIISQRNNLSFAELIQPFCTINSEIQVRDPSHQAFVIRNLHLTTCDLRASVPDENAIKLLLLSVVGDASATAVDHAQTLSVENARYTVQINTSCPWFDVYRETVTSLAPPKLHEFVSHCLACLLVVSSAHPNPIEEFSNLSQQQNHIQHQSNHSHLRWMTPNTLKYYVLLHDSSCADVAKAQHVINDLQAMYGKNVCHLLCINSKATTDQQNIPDPWSRLLSRKIGGSALESNGLSMRSDLRGGADNDLQWMSDLKRSSTAVEKGYGCCLTSADHENLRKFMHEFASDGLIPHIEKIIRNCSEQIASRKAIHKSIFRATRSLFGGNKAASAPALKTTPGGTESAELQTRKLADLFFLCQMYEHAFYYYHAAKKDFASEQTWLHAAGASEMAAFANFMQMRSQRVYPGHYVDSAIDTYSNTCNDNYLALRCAFVSLECLRQKGMYGEAAAQLLKLSNSDDDLKSALLLEQIAHCFLRSKRPLLRKFAFHIVLAGHRYGKASLRSCALLCYKSALQVYRSSGWSLAEDHINFTIGRQSYNLRHLEFAAKSFESLLVASQQAAAQQASFLQEYLVVSNRLSDATKTMSSLTIPTVCLSKSGVRSAVSSGSPGDDQTWNDLVNSVKVVADKEGCNSFPFNLNAQVFEGVVDELLLIDIHVSNPLDIALALYDAELLVEFATAEGVICEDAVEAHKLKEVVVPSNSESTIAFQLTARCTGTLTVTGVAYKLAIAKQSGFTSATSAAGVALHGMQMFSDDLSSGLDVKICEPMPLLRVEVEDFPATIMSGEIKQVRFTFGNVGKRDMASFKVASDSRVQCLFTDEGCDRRVASTHFLNSASENNQSCCCTVQSLPNKVLKPDETMSLTMWIQGGESGEPSSVHLLFYYEASERKRGQMLCRTLKYCSALERRESLQVTSSLTYDNCQSGAIVSVDAANACRDSSLEFAVSDVLCCSAHWSLTSAGSHNVQTVPAGQFLKFCFKVDDSCLHREMGQLAASRVKLQRLALCDEKEEAIVEDLTDLQLSEVMVRRVSKDRMISPGQPPDYLTVGVVWSVDNASSHGQHYLHLNKLRSDSTSLAKIGLFDKAVDVMDSSQSLAALHQLVKWSLDYDAIVQHDFSQSGLCILPVQVVLRNLYDSELQVKVDGLNAGQSNTTSGPQFLWIGKALSKFTVAPHDCKKLCLNACFTSPGVYNLNSFSVWGVPTKIEATTPLLPQNCQYASFTTICGSSQ